MQQDNDITDEKQKPQCILCGKCLEVCPLLAATGREEFSPRGKLLLLSRLAEAPETLSEVDAERLASLCLTCGRCAKACPQGTDVPAEVSRLRAKHPGFQRWLWKTWVERSGLLWPAAAKLGNVLKGKLPGRSDGVAAGLASKLATMGQGGELVPWIAAESFDACPQAPKIVLFPGCLARSVRTDWTDKALSLLNRLGAQVQDAPDWACCGGTLGHAGLLERQREAARTNIRAWREAGRPSIVTYCASCHHGLASYKELNGLEFEDGEVEVWTKALVPLSELVACGRFGVVDAAPEQVHYHQPCHAPEPDPDRAWMTKAVGERLAPVDGKACCGMGGVLQMAAPGLSSQVAGNLWERMRPAPGDQVVTGCSGCWLQLASTAPEGVCVGHWLDLLQYIETPTP